MNKNNIYNDNIDWEDKEESFRIREFLFFFWNLRYWTLLFAFAFAIVAFIYIKIASPVYMRQTMVMMANDKNGSTNEAALLSDLTGRSQNSRIDNEVYILQAPSLMATVVDELNLNSQYFEYRAPMFHSSMPLVRKFFGMKKFEFYKDNPFEINFAADSTKLITG